MRPTRLCTASHVFRTRLRGRRQSRTGQCLVIFAAAALGVGTTGCSRQPQRQHLATTSEPKTSTVGDALSAPIESPGKMLAVAGGPTKLVSADGAKGRLTLSETRRAGEWSLEARSSDNRYFLIDVPSGECDRLSSLRVLENRQSVTVVPILESPSPGTPCVPNLAVQGYVIALSAPLGKRRLLHLVQG